MIEDLHNQAELRGFLLGEVSEEQRSAIEERFLADKDFSEELGAVEDEMIEAYLRNELSVTDRRKFEAVFLTQPRRRERVLMMKGVLAAATAEAAFKTEPAPSLWATLVAPFRFQSASVRYALAAAVLVVAVLGALFVFQNLRPKPDERLVQQEPTPAPGAPAAASPLPSPILTPKAAEAGPTTQPAASPVPRASTSPTPETQPGPSFATIILRPLLVRDPRAGNKLVVASSVREIRLQLKLERKDYNSYTARITTVDGRQVWRASSIGARGTGAGTSLALSVPARRLPAGDYIVEVSGVRESGTPESVSSYFFSLVQK